MNPTQARRISYVQQSFKTQHPLLPKSMSRSWDGITDSEESEGTLGSSPAKRKSNLAHPCGQAGVMLPSHLRAPPMAGRERKALTEFASVHVAAVALFLLRCVCSACASVEGWGRVVTVQVLARGQRVIA